MSLDLKKDYKDAKNKINAHKTTIDLRKNEAKLLINQTADNLTARKSEVLKQLDDLGDVTQRAQQQIKTQFDELIDLFKMSVPANQNTNSSTIDFLLKQLLEASQNTKSRISEVFVDEVISTIGCSQEQTFIPNLDFYVRVNQIDLSKLLTNSPTETPYDVIYEQTQPINGIFPYSMDRELFERLQTPGISFSSINGQNYIGVSGNQLFDITYVTSYIDGTSTIYGDFYKIRLNNRITGNNLSDFLRDYYGSVEFLNFNKIAATIINLLFNSINISGGLTRDEIEDRTKFSIILQRILGLCFDSRKEIDVSGTAKLSDLDSLDESFFELTGFDLRNINDEINNIQNGVIEFTDCDNVKVPVDVSGSLNEIRKIIATPENKKVDKFIESINELSENNNWKLSLPTGLNINLVIKEDIIRIIPKAIMLSLLTPKTLLGLMLGVKILGSTIGDTVEDFSSFLQNFKKMIISIMSKIGSIFVEELFKLLKKNLKLLVEVLLTEIVRESKDKRLKIISGVVFTLLQLASFVQDFRECKSVIDEILKTLNLGLTALNISIPTFVLASSSILGGFSPVRAMSNVIEELQRRGIPTGDMPSGAPNSGIIAMSSQIKATYDEQLANGKTEIYIPPLAVAAFGGGTTLPNKGVGKSY
jgi:hypothetical protein